jgi:ATP-dependent DNA helicase RecG
MTWLLKDKDGIEKDYQHFGLPLILSVDQILAKIRRIRYRYMLPGTMFPEEVVSRTQKIRPVVKL